MKQLTMATGQVFGPFQFIEVHDTLYHTDHLDLPFTVVGSDCVIGDWVEPVVEPIVEEPVQE